MPHQKKPSATTMNAAAVPWPASTRITEIEGVGHIPMFEAPDRVTEAIDTFISEHSSQRRVVDPPAS